LAYSFEQIFAADPSNPANIAQNAAITIYAPGDATETPLALTDPSGSPLTNPVPVNANGFGSAFMADIDRVAWKGGGFSGFFTSYEGMKEVAVAAQTAAETAAATAGADATAVATAAIAGATDEATAAAASAATAASNASASATAAANAAALVGAPADTAIAAAVNNGASATKAALNATYALKGEAGSGGSLTGVEQIREMVRTKQINAARPLIPIGDSHTDVITASNELWLRLKTLHTQPGQGLEGLDPNAIVARGNNGQALSHYLANPASGNSYNGTVALNPSVILACWLTNDVRLGALGLTVSAIRAAGAALLNQLVANIKRDLPDTKVILRIPAPYTTVNSGANYITDGTNVNPAGLAQIYTDGVRSAHYDVLETHPEVVIYDPQTRYFGTTSPTANGGAISGLYADQIHQNILGYKMEADDFAAWVGANKPFNSAAAFEARIVQNPTSPWLAYHRAVEDTDRYIKVAEGVSVRTQVGDTFIDFGPSFPNAIPANIARGDIIVLYGANIAFENVAGTAAVNGANTRITGLPALPAGAAVNTRVAIFRRITTPDDALNVVLRDRSIRYKRTGKVQNGSTTYLDLEAKSYSEFPVLLANTWATELVAGDKVYVEGMTSTPLTIGTDTATNAAQGNSLRLTGSLLAIDWSTKVGKAVVVTGSHA